MKIPPLWAIVVVGLFCFAFYFGVSETVRKQQTARNLEIERSWLRAIDHACAPWKSDMARFHDCGGAYRAYELCEGARSRAFLREDLFDKNVACEHSVYKFHELEQGEVEQAKRSVEEKRKQAGGVQTLQE
jgi:hypothetical protein